MEFVEVKELPEYDWRYCIRRKIKGKIEEFMRMNVKIARVDFRDGEYVSSYSAYVSLRDCIERHCFPITVHHLQGQVYLCRRDI